MPDRKGAIKLFNKRMTKGAIPMDSLAEPTQRMKKDRKTPQQLLRYLFTEYNTWVYDEDYLTEHTSTNWYQWGTQD